MCRCMNNRLKGASDISSVRAAPTMIVWDLDETDNSGASEEGSVEDHDRFGLHSSNSLEEASTPQVSMLVLDDEDSIRLRRSSFFADVSPRSTTTLVEGSRSGMRGIRPSAIISISELESLDHDDILRSDEQDDLSSVMTRDSVDFEDFEIDLNDDPGLHYSSVQGSCNFYRLALSFGLGNHDSGHSEATDDDSTS